jgi:uncharacterized membrane protein YkvA (DUF1232 family)
MALKVTFELEEKDLKFFRANMKQAKEAAEQATEEQILARAGDMVSQVKSQDVPAFVQQRLDRLNALIDMVKDEEWALAAQERKNVLAALAYFADPQDMIPDNIPVLGYIDDAIMIELVVSELKHEIDAFEDFCRYRNDERSRNRNPNVSREEYLTMKRRELHARMRRRRSTRSRVGGGGRRTRIRLF